MTMVTSLAMRSSHKNDRPRVFHRPRDPVFSTDSGTPCFSIDPGTPHPGPVLSTKQTDLTLANSSLLSDLCHLKNVMFVCLLSLK